MAATGASNLRLLLQIYSDRVVAVLSKREAGPFTRVPYLDLAIRILENGDIDTKMITTMDSVSVFGRFIAPMISNTSVSGVTIESMNNGNDGMMSDVLPRIIYALKDKLTITRLTLKGFGRRQTHDVLRLLSTLQLTHLRLSSEDLSDDQVDIVADAIRAQTGLRSIIIDFPKLDPEQRTTIMAAALEFIPAVHVFHECVQRELKVINEFVEARPTLRKLSIMHSGLNFASLGRVLRKNKSLQSLALSTPSKKGSYVGLFSGLATNESLLKLELDNVGRDDIPALITMLNSNTYLDELYIGFQNPDFMSDELEAAFINSHLISLKLEVTDYPIRTELSQVIEDALARNRAETQ